MKSTHETDRLTASKAFYRALTGRDELGVVIRAHIYIEQLVNETLEWLIPYPDALDAMDLDYSQRVRLLVALGLKDQHLGSLLALGKLRNEFAHRLDAKLTAGRMNDFYKRFDSEDKKIIQRVYDSTRKKAGDRSKPKKITSLEPKDRFALYAATIHGALRAAISELSEQKEQAR